MTTCLDNWSCECSLCERERESRSVILPNRWFENFGNKQKISQADLRVSGLHQSEEAERQKKGRFVKVCGIPIVGPEKFYKLRRHMIKFFQRWAAEEFNVCMGTDLIGKEVDSSYSGTTGVMMCEFCNTEQAQAFRLCIHSKRVDKSHRLGAGVYGGYLKTLDYTSRPGYGVRKVKSCRHFCVSPQCSKVATIGKAWCYPCSKKNKQDPFQDLPMDLVVGSIIPHLSVQDVVNTLSCSKASKETFDASSVWQFFFQQKAIDTFVKRALQKFTNSKDRRIATWSWDRPDINENTTNLVVCNRSDVPYNVWFGKKFHMDPRWPSQSPWDPVKGRYRISEFQDHGIVQPGKRLVIGKVRTNTKWAVTPTKEWLLTNPVSNQCFTFQVDVTKVKEYCYGKVSKPSFVKEITNGNRKPQPIKGYGTTEFKKGFIKLATDPCFTKRFLEEGVLSEDKQLEQLKTLKAQMRVLEKQHKRTKTKNESRRMVQKIHKN